MTTTDKELDGLEKILRIMRQLDEQAQQRILDYLWDYFVDHPPKKDVE